MQQYKTQTNYFPNMKEYYAPESAAQKYYHKNHKVSSDILISGYASVYNLLDRDNEMIAPFAFADSLTQTTKLLKQKIKLLWQHDKEKPIGSINSLTEDSYGLKMEAVINSNVIFGYEAIELIKQGAVTGLSVGFIIKDAKYNSFAQRIITKAELLEISIVTFPANEEAQISHIQLDKEIQQLSEAQIFYAAIQKLRKLVSKEQYLHTTSIGR